MPTPYFYDPNIGPSGFLPEGQSLMMPPGTEMAHDSGAWAIYYNRLINITYLVYTLPKGMMIRRFPGKYNVNYNVKALGHLAKVRQALACRDCD